MGVWTAGTTTYMSEVVVGLFRLANITTKSPSLKVCLSREEATYVNRTYIKDLRIFEGVDVVLYDDSLEHVHWHGNKGNTILVPPYDALSPKSKSDCFFLCLRCEHARKTLVVR